MLRFFAPLASMVALITLTHSIIDARLARFPNPEAVLAGYAVAKSIANMLENPLYMTRQTTVALVRDRRSYRMVRLSILGLTLLISGLIACVAYIPPLTRLFLHQIMGLDGAAFDQARGALAVMPFLPFATGWRNFQQGLAILKKGNGLLPVATCVRLLYLVVFMFAVAPTLGIGGALAGSVAFVGGLGVEMIVMTVGLNIVLSRNKTHFLALRPRAGDGGRAARDPMSWSDLGGFFLPLAVTSLISTGTLPLINGFIARGSVPEVNLAAYAVALSVGHTMVNPVTMLHQVALSYVKEGDSRSRAQVVRFFTRVAATFAAMIALFAFTPLGAWLLRGPMGLPGSVAGPAQACLGFFVIIAVASAVREYVFGLLLQRRRTESIGAAKVATTVVMAGVLAAGLRLYPASMAVVAAAALALGAVVDAGILVWYTRRVERRRRQAPQATDLRAAGTGAAH